MAEFEVVMRHRKRMCKHYHSIAENACNGCPIGAPNNGYHLGCISFLLDYPQETGKIVMIWAKEHPIKTNADKFMEVFGQVGIDIYEHGCFGFDCNGRLCAECEDRYFWGKEYQGPKEKE